MGNVFEVVIRIWMGNKWLGLPVELMNAQQPDDLRGLSVGVEVLQLHNSVTTEIVELRSVDCKSYSLTVKTRCVAAAAISIVSASAIATRTAPINWASVPRLLLMSLRPVRGSRSWIFRTTAS